MSQDGNEYFCLMFVRKKKNRSGTTTVVVVEKRAGRHVYVRSIGSSILPSEIEEMVRQAEEFIKEEERGRKPEFDFDGEEEKSLERDREMAEEVFSSIEHVVMDTPRQLLDRVYDSIGFQSIDDGVFRSLVMARLSFPASKRATVEYLKSHFAEDHNLFRIYRYMDRLNDTMRERIQEVSVRHTMRIHGGKIGVLFYDVTTLYFDSDNPDELRKPGYSKDGKHSNPQIVLGLLVSADGCPLAYSIHEGNRYEGHTMLPVVTDFVRRYRLEDFVIVADSGMMSDANVRDLEANGYQYVVGARIKNMSSQTREWVVSEPTLASALRCLPLDGQKDKRLIVGYSEDRARLEAHNREKGLKKLRERYATGTITKSKITQRGYNKFLKVTGNEHITVSIDENLVAEDKRWDGLKGYITNADLKNEEAVSAYHQLYNVEQSFRIAKSKLEIRPIFHFNPNRIKAHICICFVALKVYRELGRLLKANNIGLSVDAVLNIAKTIPNVTVNLSGNAFSKTLFLTDRHKQIQPLFEEKFWVSQNYAENKEDT